MILNHKFPIYGGFFLKRKRKEKKEKKERKKARLGLWKELIIFKVGFDLTKFKIQQI